MKNRKIDLYTVYKMLEDGVHFYKFIKHLGRISDSCSLYATDKYIRWQNFGSSANNKGLHELAWIILVIFDINMEEFIDTMIPYKYDQEGRLYQVYYEDYLV